MLHLWHREWLLRPDASRIWNTHLTRAQPGELPVGAALNRENGSILNISSDNSNGSCVHLRRFFLMYLINKDETEHTGQVRIGTCLLKAVCLVSRVWSSSRRLCKITETSDAFFFFIFLCNISTHLLCCIRAAGGRSNAWALFFFLFWYLLIVKHLSLKLFYLMFSHSSYVTDFVKGKINEFLRAARRGTVLSCDGCCRK